MTDSNCANRLLSLKSFQSPDSKDEGNYYNLTLLAFEIAASHLLFDSRNIH